MAACPITSGYLHNRRQADIKQKIYLLLCEAYFAVLTDIFDLLRINMCVMCDV